MEISRLMRGGTAEPVSRDQILRRERGQGNMHFRSSADHEQDWQPYPVDSYSAMCVTIHTYKYIIHFLGEGKGYYLVGLFIFQREQASPRPPFLLLPLFFVLLSSFILVIY